MPGKTMGAALCGLMLGCANLAAAIEHDYAPGAERAIHPQNESYGEPIGRDSGLQDHTGVGGSVNEPAPPPEVTEPAPQPPGTGLGLDREPGPEEHEETGRPTDERASSPNALERQIGGPRDRLQDRLQERSTESARPGRDGSGGAEERP
jgi:hypothetical protein